MILDVVVPFRVPRSFHYRVDEELGKTISPGSLVQVPFKNRSTHAFVLGFAESSPYGDRLKAIEGVLAAEPLFDEKMLKLLVWMSEYYCHPLGEVCAAAVPRNSWRTKEKGKRKRKEATPIEGLAPLSTERPQLTVEQEAVLGQILAEGEKRPYLLHGVTGSGKTEVYMRALETAIAKGKGAIILVPEIALTPQLLGRFSARFPGQVAVLHSDLTPRERFQEWARVRAGEARVVIGPRSAVFAPVRELGLIVVDEEQEASFKQEDSLRYNARDVAVVRGGIEGAKVILGSATPSLETYANARSGKYVYLEMKERVTKRAMPATVFVDIKDSAQVVSARMPWLSQVLLAKMEKTLKAGQQSLLYLNRLGFAHFLFCKDCGHTWKCRNCDVSLTYYRHPPVLRCHYCGAHRPPPNSCENCQGTDLESMGVGTEQVEKGLREVMPGARVARMDRSVVKTRKDLEEILAQIARKEIDVVIGTQMIAKGHDFPGIALVGILVADASLNLPDFRANERTFQIITQVSGRAGRADIAGEVVVQTLNPGHPVLMAAAENRGEEFYRMEMETRRVHLFPPYQRLAMVRFQHRDERRVEGFAMEVVQFLRKQIQSKGIAAQIVGPAEAPLSRVKNVYRWHCMVRSESVRALQTLLHFGLEYADHKKSTVRMDVDVDPVSSL